MLHTIILKKSKTQYNYLISGGLKEIDVQFSQEKLDVKYSQIT